jgi:nucleoside 2-deoxyribosyltransferase
LPGTIYLAHRLFAIHDRMLAADLAAMLHDTIEDADIFLPYCDSNEDTLLSNRKGFVLFSIDTQRLRTLTAMVAILHGPSLDDGVCMELGFAHAIGVPIVLMTTDFQTYSVGASGQHTLFADPLLEVIADQIVRVPHPYPEVDTDPAEGRFVSFRRRNQLALEEALAKTACAVQQVAMPRPLSQVRPHATARLDDPRQRSSSRRLYIEDSPYISNGDRYSNIRRLAEENGWLVRVATRFAQTHDGSAQQRAAADLTHARASDALLLDGNGPETPGGAAFHVGAALARGQTSILCYGADLYTHADGRELNARNLMIHYGATHFVVAPDDALPLLTVSCGATRRTGPSRLTP